MYMPFDYGLEQQCENTFLLNMYLFNKSFNKRCRLCVCHLKGLGQFRPPIALRTDLSRITTELWEIPVFSPADCALILHMIT